MKYIKLTQGKRAIVDTLEQAIKVRSEAEIELGTF
jgi:hypothetical protein